MASTFAPLFQTPETEHNKAETNKRDSNGMRGELAAEFRNDTADLTWEAEQLAKSYGIYLEFNRAKSGRDKDWIYMIRIGLPGGGPISPDTWSLLDDLAETYAVNPEGYASLRLTTRQAIQFHWVRKEGVIPIVKQAAEAGILSLNACGDNVRNVLACPLSAGSPDFDALALARELGAYFQLSRAPFVQIFAVDPNALEALPPERFQYGPQLLNRKFKMAVAAVHRHHQTGLLEPDNCVEVRTHDLGIVPRIVDDQVDGFQIFVGGGQGENNGKETASLLAKPFAVTDRAGILPITAAIVAVHQEWGDRKHRHWARLKYLVRAKGVDWLRERVAERLGYMPEPADPTHDPGPRRLHHGWIDNGETAHFGAFVENGRLIDNSPNGRLKTMVRALSSKYNTTLLLTANQDIIFSGIPVTSRAAFEADLAHFGYGRRGGKPYSQLRLASGACVGRDTCRLAYTDSEQFEPELIDALEDLGWGHLSESIGITGCERQCFRPGTKTIGLIGSGLNRYTLKLFGAVDARHQGRPLREGDEIYLRSVPRDQVAPLLDTLFRYYEVHRDANESLGYFLRRIGDGEIIHYLKVHPRTAKLMEKKARDKALRVS